MALRPDQQALSLLKLYEISQENRYGGQTARIFINSGTVDIYGSDSATQPISLATMTLNTVNTGVSGIAEFSESLPRYIAIKQKTGTTTELVVTFLNAVDKGAIS